MEKENFTRYLNTILLSIIITVGGAFSAFMGGRSIKQGEDLATIKASQVTKTEIDNRFTQIQNEFNLGLARLQTEQLSLRAKMTEIEIKQATNLSKTP